MTWVEGQNCAFLCYLNCALWCTLLYDRFLCAKFFYLEFIVLCLLMNRIHTYQKVRFFPARMDLAVKLSNAIYCFPKYKSFPIIWGMPGFWSTPVGCCNLMQQPAQHWLLPANMGPWAWGPRGAQSCALTLLIDWGQCPKQADVLLGGGGDRANGLQSTPLFRWWCVATALERFEDHIPTQPPLKEYQLAWGIILDQYNVLKLDTRPPVRL